jgi:parallel beta-helix repeat protein
MMRDDVPREDKDGNPRPLPAGSNPDMGAYEHELSEIPMPIHNLSTGEGFSSIQEAIDDSDTLDGHVIEVNPGSYTENVTVNKSLTIRSSSGVPEGTAVQAADSSLSVFLISADGVTISGFTISGATESSASGINLQGVRGCRLINNVLAGNGCGIFAERSDGNFILNNMIRDNSEDGIRIYESSDNIIRNNAVSRNDDNGIFIDRTGWRNRIVNNRIEDNHGAGVRIWGNNNENLVILNLVTGNGIGIDLQASLNNQIFLNDFTDNDDNIPSPSGYPAANWHTPAEISYQYRGEHFTGYLGNHWDDYHDKRPDGDDSDGNGVWDLPYPINSLNDEEDPYPLVSSVEDYTITEEWGPDGEQADYDGNGDGVPDSEQNNVASLHTFDGTRYVTIESPEGTSLWDVRPVNPEDILADPPEDVDFPWGLFSFVVEGVPEGGSVILTLYLHGAEERPTTYYKYGPEPGDPSSHWYEFTFDGSTGAEIVGDVIRLHFVDGDRGDDDLLANGIIVDSNGPGISSVIPSISISPSSLDFGVVTPGDSKEMTLTITNQGSGRLIIGSITISGENASEFHIQQDNCSNQTIQPGTSCDLVIAFEPESQGAKSATLNIPSNDPSNPLVSVDLMGGGLILGDVSQNGEVTAYDASMILRYLVGIEDLSDAQLAVADVSGNGSVSAYDASMILRFVVGLIGGFSGSSRDAPQMEGKIRTVSLLSPKSRAGERITVPVVVDNPEGIISGELTIRFDRKGLRFVEARSDFRLASHLDGDRLKLAFAGEGASRSKELVHLIFEVKESSLEHVDLELAEVRLNEGVRVRREDGKVELIPIRTVLLQNYPNPFNPETWIPFKLAENAYVEIRIYDITGKLVRRLDLGYREAGSYTNRNRAAYWDGRNELGERVASGVYVYRLQVGGKEFIRRMVILK